MNIAIIGLGSMGKRRIRLLRQCFSDIVLVGIDNNPERIKQTSEHMDCYLNIEDIPATKKIDIAFVCTAPLTHSEIIAQCINRDWHVFSEINLIDQGYLENIKLAKKKDKILFLSSTPLYREEMICIREKVKNEKLPLSYLYHVGQYLPDWHPWESIKDFFVHHVATSGCREIFAIELPWMIKTFGEIERVQVVTNISTDLEIDYPDTYFVQILHKTGHKGVFCVDVVCRKPVRKLEIYNEKIYIEWNGTPDTLLQKNLQTGQIERLTYETSQRNKNYCEFINEVSYKNEMEYFFSVLNGKEIFYGFEDDIKTLQWIDKIEGK